MTPMTTPILIPDPDDNLPLWVFSSFEEIVSQGSVGTVMDDADENTWQVLVFCDDGAECRRASRMGFLPQLVCPLPGQTREAAVAARVRELQWMAQRRSVALQLAPHAGRVLL